MAQTVIVPVRANVGFDDLASSFEVCATVLLDIPIIGGIRTPKVCVNAGTLAGILSKLVTLWTGGVDPQDVYGRAFEVGDISELTAQLTVLEALPYMPRTSPPPPAGNDTADPDVVEYTGDYGITTP